MGTEGESVKVYVDLKSLEFSAEDPELPPSSPELLRLSTFISNNHQEFQVAQD